MVILYKSRIVLKETAYRAACRYGRSIQPYQLLNIGLMIVERYVIIERILF
jgi:hypothetical protein